MNYLINIPAGGYKCCVGFGIAIEIKKMIEQFGIKVNRVNKISYAGVSSGACIAFILCHNSSNKYKLNILKKIIKLEISNDNIFIQLDKIREIFHQMLLPNKNNYLQFNNKLHIGLIYNFKFTIVSNFCSNENLLDILIASITLFPLTYDLYQWIHLCPHNQYYRDMKDQYQDNHYNNGIAFDGAYYTKSIDVDAFGAFAEGTFADGTFADGTFGGGGGGKYINYTFDYDEIGITDEYFLIKKDYNLYKKLFLFGQQYVKNNYNAIKKKLKLT